MNYLIEALTLGVLYGLGPCTIFCAPILIPLIISTSKSSREGIVQTFSFGFGRILSYTFLGLISGYVDYLFGNLISKELIGIFILGLGVFILIRKYPKCLFLIKVDGKHVSFPLRHNCRACSMLPSSGTSLFSCSDKICTCWRIDGTYLWIRDSINPTNNLGILGREMG